MLHKIKQELREAVEDNIAGIPAPEPETPRSTSNLRLANPRSLTQEIITISSDTDDESKGEETGKGEKEKGVPRGGRE